MGTWSAQIIGRRGPMTEARKAYGRKGRIGVVDAEGTGLARLAG